ncbi:FAD-dependent oxidoreductase [Actinophytocola xinjiangensis]|uniref:FAD-dependent oxidoreductase n=1 Tax=Actinophytocola xinjiangensis TaxID=485602 RepID=A0A7Z0WPW5_9PSEU|nr:FAD-dependent oxidoreductase [Actinophytocola xinjiangensis]OLF11769.1 FAD-dependent oxidoreductase [Actinophytocola xinjiangensis]
MADPTRIVIIGTGLAGATAAGELRAQGYSGQLVLLGQDTHRPYELPALSKGILLGEATDPDWVHDESFYAERDIDLRLSTVVSSVGDHEVVEAGGTRHPFDRLLLATGSTPRRLEQLPGAGLAGLRTLRTLDDSRALRAELTAGTRVVIVGGGWIGCEVAAAARSHGAEVTVIDPVSLPLRGVLGDTVAGVFRDLHTEHGVTWRLGTGVTGFTGESTVTGVSLDDGTTLPADLVLLAVGAAPRVELARAMGLDLAEGGVAVDAGLRTSAPDVYAVGDLAAHDHPRHPGRLRIEHWANAKDQGAHVARNLLGAHDPYTASPYFFSDQYDLGMEFRGLADPATDELVVRGDLAAREFIAFWLRDGAVRAAMNVNLWDDGEALGALVDNGVRVEPAKLVAGDLASMMG